MLVGYKLSFMFTFKNQLYYFIQLSFWMSSFNDFFSLAQIAHSTTTIRLRYLRATTPLEMVISIIFSCFFFVFFGNYISYLCFFFVRMLWCDCLVENWIFLVPCSDVPKYSVRSVRVVTSRYNENPPIFLCS